MLSVTDKARDHILERGGSVFIYTTKKASLC